MRERPDPTTAEAGDALDDPVRREVELAIAAQDDLDNWLAALLDTDRLDVAQPSRLPGWTVGHLLAHLRFNAESHTRMFDAAARGERVEQYPGGAPRREREIDEHASDDGAEQVAEVRRSGAELTAAWRASSWDGAGIRGGGLTPLTDLPFLRVREVLLHRVDLGLGYELADLPTAYVRLELRRLEMLWTARQPMGLTALPAPALALAPHDRLGWLAGRIEVAALAPADVF